jgi:hypothetical protein
MQSNAAASANENTTDGTPVPWPRNPISEVSACAWFHSNADQRGLQLIRIATMTPSRVGTIVET